MNYLKEILAFNELVEYERIPPSEQVLWYALMSIANSLNWPDSFTVAVLTLQSKTCLEDKTIQRARNRLVQRGLIQVTSRGANRAASYSIKSLEKQFGMADLSRTVSDTMSRTMSRTVSDSVSRSMSRSMSPLNKLNKTKQGEEDKSYRASAGAREEVLPPRAGPPSEREQRTLTSIRVWLGKQSEGLFDGHEELHQLLNSDRFPVDLIWEALFATVQRNSRYGRLKDPMAYAMSLLFDWEEQGIKSSPELMAFRALGRVEPVEEAE